MYKDYYCSCFQNLPFGLKHMCSCLCWAGKTKPTKLRKYFLALHKTEKCLLFWLQRNIFRNTVSEAQSVVHSRKIWFLRLIHLVHGPTSEGSSEIGCRVNYTLAGWQQLVLCGALVLTAQRLGLWVLLLCCKYYVVWVFHTGEKNQAELLHWYLFLDCFLSL